MGQRELRAAFLRVYGSATQSFNNAWLRRKLAEGEYGCGNGAQHWCAAFRICQT